MNPYVDPATGVHYNKLGIEDRQELRQAEYMITTLRALQLMEQPVTGRYDLAHLRQVHEHLFQDVYEWAGKVRTLNFTKVDPVDRTWTSPFAPHDKIEAIAVSIASDLQSWDYLRGLSKTDFTAGIVAVYVKLNYMHPFPEGNGRSTQLLLSQLAREAGYDLDFARVSPRDWNQAAARSMPQRHLRDATLTRKADIGLISRAFREVVTGPVRQHERADPSR